MTDLDIQEQAALYALGALGQNEARALDELIARGSPDNLARLKAFEDVVAVLGLGSPPIDPSPEVRHRLLEEVSTTQAEAPSAADFAIIRADDSGWSQIAQGVLMKELFVNKARGTTTFLLRIQPGGKVPAHRHTSIEEIFVIEGQCHINSEILHPGDYRCAQAGTADRLLTSEKGTTVLVMGPSRVELL